MRIEAYKKWYARVGRMKCVCARALIFVTLNVHIDYLKPHFSVLHYQFSTINWSHIYAYRMPPTINSTVNFHNLLAYWTIYSHMVNHFYYSREKKNNYIYLWNNLNEEKKKKPAYPQRKFNNNNSKKNLTKNKMCIELHWNYV